VEFEAPEGPPNHRTLKPAGNLEAEPFEDSRRVVAEGDVLEEDAPRLINVAASRRGVRFLDRRLAREDCEISARVESRRLIRVACHEVERLVAGDHHGVDHHEVAMVLVPLDA